RLDHHQMDVDRLVGQPAQRGHHGGAEGQVRDEAAVHHVHVQPVGAAVQHGADLLRQAGQVDRQDAGGDPHVAHYGLRATMRSTTVPGAASVPAAGRCATTVPGFASPVRRRVTVPTSRPSVSSRVVASATDIPSRSGTGMVGAPRLTTTTTPPPGASNPPAAGRVSMAIPVGVAAWTDSTCATVSPAATIRRCASVPSNPVTSGTGILGGPALATRVTRNPAGALTPGGGSCQTTEPSGALGCGSVPPSRVSNPALRICCVASGSGRPSTRGTTWRPCRIGVGKIRRYAVR